MDEPNVAGSMQVLGGAERSVTPRSDGPVLSETREALELGIDSQDPLDAEVLDRVIVQAEDLVGRILGAYEATIAPGEVGPGGSGVASAAAVPSDADSTGLLYGKVQSGKTLAMIASTALALDNGFRVVVVLTSDNVELVSQTAKRFAVLQGALVRSSNKVGSWAEDPDHIKAALKDNGLVLVTAKNATRLNLFCRFLKKIGAERYPALILDDEADQATLDTTTRKRAIATEKGEDVGDLRPSRIFGWTNGEGDSIRQALPHHFYLQVTATPYALLLQNVDSILRPAFTAVLAPGEGYVGGDFFFPTRAFSKGAITTPLRFVNEDEPDELLGKGSTKLRLPPEGLDCALATFLVAATAQGAAQPKVKYQAQNFLVHTSARKQDHGHVARLIRDRLGTVYDWIQSEQNPMRVETFLALGQQEMAKSLDVVPTIAQIVDYVRRRYHDRLVLVVNSDKDAAQFGPRLNFIVGGNILGRGLTISNLLVTYYLRSAKVAQMDTVLQHARMFGYRSKDKPYLRLFLPELQAARFARISRSEQQLRDSLQRDPTVRAAVEVVKGLRPTRLSVLDPYSVEAFGPGEHLYPHAPLKVRKGGIVKVARSRDVHREACRRFIDTFYGGSSTIFGDKKTMPDERLRATTIEAVVDAVGWLPASDRESERGSWKPRVLKRLLQVAADRLGPAAYVYARKATRKSIVEGMLSGKEVSDLRSTGAPVLCAFWDDSEGVSGVDFPYLFPEMVLPNRLPTQIMNVGGLDD